jgi:hypothetical protein
MKISKAQERVIRRLQDGWSLGKGIGVISNVWMQSGKLGCGGKSGSITFATLNALIDRKLIEQKQYKHYAVEYILTDLGKSLKLCAERTEPKEKKLKEPSG